MAQSTRKTSELRNKFIAYHVKILGEHFKKVSKVRKENFMMPNTVTPNRNGKNQIYLNILYLLYMLKEAFV